MCKFWLKGRGRYCSRPATSGGGGYCWQHVGGKRGGPGSACPRRFPPTRWLLQGGKKCVSQVRDQSTGLTLVIPKVGTVMWKGSCGPIPALAKRVSWFGQWENSLQYAQMKSCKGTGYMHDYIITKSPVLVRLDNARNVRILKRGLSPYHKRLLGRITGIDRTSLTPDPHVSYPCRYKNKPRSKFARSSTMQEDVKVFEAICQRYPFIDGWYQSATTYCGGLMPKKDLFLSEVALCDPPTFLRLRRRHKVH